MREFVNEALVLKLTDRVHMSGKTKIEFKTYDQRKASKPSGLWYGFGDSWLNWVKSEMPGWERSKFFKLELDLSKMLRLEHSSDLLSFTKKYRIITEIDSNYYIDWPKIAKEYSGIEIDKYYYNHRYDLNWYYSWDVASGCVWNQNAIIKIKRIK
jgi:hypothetical protein